MFTEKIETFLDLVCEANLFSLSFGCSYGWLLHTGHVWKEYLGMKWFVCENPLRRWKSLRGFLNIIPKYLYQRCQVFRMIRRWIRQGRRIPLRCILYFSMSQHYYFYYMSWWYPFCLFFLHLFHFLFWFSFLLGPH